MGVADQRAGGRVVTEGAAELEEAGAAPELERGEGVPERVEAGQGAPARLTSGLGRRDAGCWGPAGHLIRSGRGSRSSPDRAERQGERGASPPASRAGGPRVGRASSSAARPGRAPGRGGRRPPARDRLARRGPGRTSTRTSHCPKRCPSALFSLPGRVANHRKPASQAGSRKRA